MIHPSYQELIQAINEGQESEDEPLVTSRYSIVLATSKRARQLIAGAQPMVKSKGRKELCLHKKGRNGNDNNSRVRRGRDRI